MDSILIPSTPLAAGRRPAFRLSFVPLLLGVAAGRHACGDPERSGDGRTGSAPAREVRAVWVTRWDYRTEEDVRSIIARSASLNLNRVVFQVRGQADAFYRSSLGPWGEELWGPSERNGDPGFDPLETAIDEARRRGLELHAWANLLPGWKGPTPPRSEKHVVHLHP